MEDKIAEKTQRCALLNKKLEDNFLKQEQAKEQYSAAAADGFLLSHPLLILA
jgi:hypothetical protein